MKERKALREGGMFRFTGRQQDVAVSQLTDCQCF